VWSHFEHLNVYGGTGTSFTSAMATCRRCRGILRACTKKHGTSQLWRHARSCAELENWINDLVDVAEFDGAGRLIIGGEVAAAGNQERRSSNSMPGISSAVVVKLLIIFGSLA
jgi:hypothetical protein